MTLKPNEGISALVLLAVLAFVTFLVGYYYGKRSVYLEIDRYVQEHSQQSAQERPEVWY